ncbi:LysR family transcriptional regulator [Metapseudomonas resinovorans]|uniref:Putative LysR family transcriptional regulator n=1 Tax=Metapseudomonas resinovorans NBRC 106553 TaxID=1245471 RepID=S6BKT3_METRE|nr:LysR family transcriptional regulator [Pseudomonas resinovorans]BAN49884.1 putative LysR family transcriptional regulator [Pseudomonas resinovorans NBRC 106553]
MARPDVNRFGEMDVFVRVVETGGFSAAAQKCGMTPSAVSKLVARLEDRLGARLFNRSTRRQQLTAEGAAFYDRSLRILADLDEAEREASASATAQGKVRLSCNLPVGRQLLIPALPLFFERYPGVSLDLHLSDEVVDLLEERADVAIRSGTLKDSRLVARFLGESGHQVVAAPDYLARHGAPQHPRELVEHNCLGFSYRRIEPDWPFLGRQAQDPEPIGNTLASDGDSLRHLVLAGLGLARLGTFQVRDDIAAGRLVPVLEDFNPGDTKPMHALYLGKGGHLPARVRAVLDFLAEHVRIA